MGDLDEYRVIHPACALLRQFTYVHNFAAEIAVFVRENDDGSVKASLRSTGFNVAEVSAKFGGGGHIRAAGCTLPVKTADEGAKIIIDEIKKQMRK